MRSRFTARILLSGGALVSLALSGCSATSGVEADQSGLVKVVASTDVYGDIAEQIGGEFVEVTSIVSGAAQDPHSYEATARDQLALSKAELVIENGGGYDPFIDVMLDASGGETVVVLNASEASGLIDGDVEHDDHAGDDHEGDDHPDEGEDHAEEGVHDRIEGFNEHVWYSFSGVTNIAREIAHELAELDPSNADAYEANLAAFAGELESLEEKAHAMHELADGAGVVITEPVPTYLLEEIGFENRTPNEFSESIEEGTDVAPAVLQQTLALFSDSSVALLAYNEQTAGAATEQARDAAEAAGVKVVSLTETLPDGEGYISWMSANLDAIADALA